LIHRKSPIGSGLYKVMNHTRLNLRRDHDG
jgi:hypothetical protein